MDKFGYFTTGVIIGGVAGGVAALMLSPRTGEENRQLVADYASTVATNAQQFGNQAYDTVQGGLKVAGEKGNEILGNVKDAREKATAQFSEKNDELRSKIEAARERIAEQVKKNATQAEETIKLEDNSSEKTQS